MNIDEVENYETQTIVRLSQNIIRWNAKYMPHETKSSIE